MRAPKMQPVPDSASSCWTWMFSFSKPDSQRPGPSGMFEAAWSFSVWFSQLMGGPFDKAEKESHVTASEEKQKRTYLKISLFPSGGLTGETATWSHRPSHSMRRHTYCFLSLHVILWPGGPSSPSLPLRRGSSIRKSSQALESLLWSRSVFPMDIQVVETVKGLRFYTTCKWTISRAVLCMWQKAGDTRIRDKDVFTPSSRRSQSASICSWALILQRDLKRPDVTCWFTYRRGNLSGRLNHL